MGFDDIDIKLTYGAFAHSHRSQKMQRADVAQEWYLQKQAEYRERLKVDQNARQRTVVAGAAARILEYLWSLRSLRSVSHHVVAKKLG